jgi:hypothetical protein
MKTHLPLLLMFCLFCIFRGSASAQLQNDSILIKGNASYYIISGITNMTIDSKTGGRITSFKSGNYEFLTGKDIHPDNYGSTFWPSPQSIWNWPPPPVLDNEPYQIEDNGKIIKAVSAHDPVTGLQFIKEILAENNRVDITYSIVNISQEVRKTAPWEVTRAFKGGLLFFPIGETPVSRKSFEQAPSETIDGIVWYQDAKGRPKNNQLSIADGSEGWVAYAIDGKLLIKKYKDLKPGTFAPGESEISFYISAEADYIEIELQGKYEAINPGEKTVWHVEWIAADIPANIKVEKGSKELAGFVRGIIK